MTGRQFTFGSQGNPLVQLLSLVVFGVLVVGAVIMGAFVLLAFLGFAAVAVLVFAVRSWWLKRKLRSGGDPFEDEPKTAHEVRYIEGEYEVVDADSDADSDVKSRRLNGER